jgi:hypothetical protein
MSESRIKATLPQRAKSEFKELVILTAYLYVTLGTVIVMKTAVLHSYGIHSVLWGVAIVKALLLAKFMLIGRAMKLGEGHTTGPLIWPTLYKAAAFLVLLIVMTLLEQITVGLFHHQSVAASLSELGGARLPETVAGMLVVLLVLIPYFAFHVLDEELGEGTLKRMFFVDRKLVPVGLNGNNRQSRMQKG